MAKRDASESSKPSKILLDELYVAEDDRFLECFAQFDSYELLKHFSLKWIEDPRPWARSQLIDYLHGGLNDPGHEVVFKQMLKWAFNQGDDELLTHFMVVLDGLVRRKRTVSHTYNYRTRRSSRREYLFAKPNRTVRNQTGRFHEFTYRKQVQRIPLPDIRNQPHYRLFSQKTRAHLRRRIWRYFRFMAHREPQRYVDAMANALAVYDDSFFSSGEAILDNWSLMHACFCHAPEIAFTPSHTNVLPGHSLSALRASPYLPTVWQGDSVAEKLWTLLAKAKSQFVRMWTIDMLRGQHEEWLSNVSVENLVQLLSSRDATVVEFAADLFRGHPSLARVEVSTWLRLLENADFSVLPKICDIMRDCIDPGRLSDDQLVELTMARPASVAAMGLAWLQSRHQQHPLDGGQLVRLSGSQCVWEAETIAKWAIEELATPERYTADNMVRFFDAQSQAVRQAACLWLQSGKDGTGMSTGEFQYDPVIWTKLSETPYDEVRFSLLEVLGVVLDRAPKQVTDKLTVDQYLRICTAIVLCVDRGSRSKPKAIKQLADLVEREPLQAEVVLPVLAIAADSVRDPERFAGLAALTRLIDRRPELVDTVSRFMPQWSWEEAASTGGTHES